MSEPHLRLQQAALLGPPVEDGAGTIDPTVLERCHARALHQHASELLQVSWKLACLAGSSHAHALCNVEALTPNPQRAAGTGQTHTKGDIKHLRRSS